MSRLLALALAAHSAAAWLAVGTVAGGKIDVFQMDDTGAKVKDVLSFAVKAGEVVDPNAFACGRCFCLVLATNAAARTSTVYNMSFCIVPTPVLQSAVALPGLAYNMHSMEGEGDGGNGFTILIDHTKTPQTYNVVQIVANKVVQRASISQYVDMYQGNVFPGGTAFCAETMTLWVAIQTASPTHDTLIAVDLTANKVVSNISIVKPALAAHFADCSTNSVGGVTQSTDAAGVTTVTFGMLTAAGAFNVLDSAKLPAGSKLALSGSVDFMHDPRIPWDPSEYGALLYTGGKALPGALFTSSAGKAGPAKLSPVAVVAAAISVEY